MRGGINQVVGQKSPAVEDGISLLVFRGQIRLGRRHQKIFTVNFVTAFGEEPDVRGRGGTEIENAERCVSFPHPGKFAETAGTAVKFLRRLGCARLCPAR